jgi:hypothetical protein
MFKKIFGRGSESGGHTSGGGGGGAAAVKRTGQPSADATNRTINSIQQLADVGTLHPPPQFLDSALIPAY